MQSTQQSSPSQESPEGFLLPTVADHVRLQSAVQGMLHRDRPKNTQKIYNRVENEWTAYCAHVDRHNTLCQTHMSMDKVFNFMFYQAFREVKIRGGINGGDKSDFDPMDFDDVIESFKAAYSAYINDQSGTVQLPSPYHGLGGSSMEQYQAALRALHLKHMAAGITSRVWENVWSVDTKGLVKIVKGRTARQKKLTYQEKVETEFGPYKAVERYGKIEQEIRRQSSDTPRSSMTTWLRNRFVFLYSLSGILRAESLYRAELSDFLGITVKKEEDIHPLYVMITQVPEGKTNHGRTIYGRATRHKNVSLCALGALSMYLTMRFHITKEFLESTFNWLDNGAWFDVKLLVDVNRGKDFTKPMTTNTYAKAMAQVLTSLGIVKTHLAHIGRVLGTKILEMLEVESEEIRRLGNWNPSIQDKSYSTKLPMKPIRRLAGFSTGNGIHFNHRTMVAVPMSLQKMTPIGKWVFTALETVETANEDGAGKYTAQNFLQFLVQMNIIFLQDMAVLYNQGTPRHCMFQVIDVLQSVEFSTFCERMKHELHNQGSPLDASLESVLPGIHDRLDAQRKATIDLEQKVLQIGSDVKDTIIENSRKSYKHVASIFSEINKIIQAGPIDSDARTFEQDIESATVDDDDVDEPFKKTSHNFLIQQRYETLMQLHDHWFGQGEFRCSQLGISIDTLEKRHRNKWRKKFYTSAHETQFSRAKRIIEAIKSEADKQKVPVDMIASMWSKNFENEGRLKLPNVIKWLVEHGYIQKKKKRGISKTD